MFSKPSLLTRITVAKLIGLALGAIGFSRRRLSALSAC